MGLLLAAFLSLQQLYPHQPTNHPESKANHLEDVDRLLKEKPCSDAHAALRLFAYSFQRIVQANVGMTRGKNILQPLVDVLTTDAPALTYVDIFLDLYWTSRLCLTRTHSEALATLPATLDHFKATAMSLLEETNIISTHGKSGAYEKYTVSGQPSQGKITTDLDQGHCPVLNDSQGRTSQASVTYRYACTFVCEEVFDKKDDWKNHERSQHFQLEFWRCRQSDGIKQCAKLAWHKREFDEHLRGDHGIILEKNLRKELHDCHLGKGGTFQFWCGFCRDLEPSPMERLEAWNKRSIHIGRHYESGADIKDWFPVDGGRSKREQEALDTEATFSNRGDPRRVRQPWFSGQ